MPKVGTCTGRCIWVGLALALVLDCLGGCGRSGAPIPPEDIGVAAKLERERRERARTERQESATEAAASEGVAEEGVPEPEPALPPLRPIGTR